MRNTGSTGLRSNKGILHSKQRQRIIFSPKCNHNTVVDLCTTPLRAFLRLQNDDNLRRDESCSLRLPSKYIHVIIVLCNFRFGWMKANALFISWEQRTLPLSNICKYDVHSSTTKDRILLRCWSPQLVLFPGSSHTTGTPKPLSIGRTLLRGSLPQLVLFPKSSYITVTLSHSPR